MERTRRKWEELRLKHRALFQQIRREIPGFWAEVAELGQCHLEETTTTRGAVVRELPATREMGTQTDGDATAGKEKKESRDQGVQTPSQNVTLAALEAAADREYSFLGADREARARQRENPEERARRNSQEAPRSTTRPGRTSPNRQTSGCWNCGEPSHRYTACPKSRRRDFCYRCGKLGVTLRECPRCRSEWRDEGPYRPGKSVPRDPLRRGE